MECMVCRWGDSLDWNAWYVDAWLTATARMACGWVTRRKWYARHVGMLTHGKWNVIHYAKQHQFDWQPVCTSPLLPRGPEWAGWWNGMRVVIRKSGMLEMSIINVIFLTNVEKWPISVPYLLLIEDVGPTSNWRSLVDWVRPLTESKPLNRLQ